MDGLPIQLHECVDEIQEVPQEYLKMISGIYFLCHNEKIQYIGASEHVISRVMQHVWKTEKEVTYYGDTTIKKFTHIYFLPVPLEDLGEKEQYYIHKFQPPLNKKLLKGPKQLPPTVKKRIIALRGIHKADMISRIVRRDLSQEEIDSLV